MYGYNYGYYTEPTGTEGMIILGVMLGLMVFYLLIIGIAIANYVMTALGLQKIATRRQIPNPWMAWLPYARSWLIGNIADEYDGRNGFRRKWRVVLLTLSLITVGMAVIMYVVLFAGIFATAFKITYSNTFVSSDVIGFFIAIYVTVILLSLVAVAQSFCQAICIYKIFESTVPEKSVKYLLFYLLVPLGGAICLLKCKDKGYPQPQEIWENQMTQ